MKKIFFFLAAIVLFSACKKRGDLPELPTYTRFKLTTTSADRYFEVMLGDTLLQDSLSANVPISGFVVTGEQRFTIKEAGASGYLLDTVLDVTRPGLEFTLLDIGGGSKPVLLSPKDLETTPPAAGSYKYSLINVDTSFLMKDRTVDVGFYEIQDDGASFRLITELKGLEYAKASDFLELENILTSTFFLQITDSNTGEVLLPVENFMGMMSIPTMDANVYLMKLANMGDDSWTFVSADPLLWIKL